MDLILCEKPSQAKDIAAALGVTQRGDGVISNGSIQVTWAFGRLLGQAAPDTYNTELKYWNLAHLPVLPQKWILESKSSSAAQYKIITNLIKALTANDTLIIATDADREGEVIAREVMDKVGCKAQIKRLWLSALDVDSIKKGFANLRPGNATETLYHSGLGRQRADWLAGMNMTMALTTAFGQGGKDGVLHCGRVQSPTLNLIVRREESIRTFKPSLHYLLKTKFNINSTEVPMSWQVPDKFKNSAGHIVNKADIDDVVHAVQGKTGTVTAVEKTRQHKAPPKLFYLGSLQQEASKKHGIKVQVTLDICQSLYEKHKATTYPRTDSEYLPISMFSDVGTILGQLSKYQFQLADLIASADSSNIKACFNDKKVTGHHAIVPTNNPNVDVSAFSREERIIYDLICKRYIAQFLPDYAFDQTVIKVNCAAYEFKATGKVERIKGWQQLYQTSLDNTEADNNDTESDNLKLPAAVEGDLAKNTHCESQPTTTKPPLRYTEDTLLKAMESIDKEIDDERLRKIMQTKEKAGIGTDATRGNIIENLFNRNYIKTDKKYLIPTDKGEHLIRVFEVFASDIIDPVLTATWEDKLNQIEQGNYTLPAFEHEIGAWLQSIIESIRQSSDVIKRNEAQANRPSHPCPTCGKPMYRNESKFKKGKYYWSCSAFKETGCNTTMDDKNGQPVPKAAPPVKSEHLCGLCGRPLIFRQGTINTGKHKGKSYKLWGCSGFPKCKQSYNDDNGKPQFN